MQVNEPYSIKLWTNSTKPQKDQIFCRAIIFIPGLPISGWVWKPLRPVFLVFPVLIMYQNETHPIKGILEAETQYGAWWRVVRACYAPEFLSLFVLPHVHVLFFVYELWRHGIICEDQEPRFNVSQALFVILRGLQRGNSQKYADKRIILDRTKQILRSRRKKNYYWLPRDSPWP